MTREDGSDAIAHLALTREHSERRAFWLDLLAEAGRARPELTGLAVPARPSRGFAALREALDGLADPLVVVLDDFHAIGTGDVLADIEALLAHAHPNLRIVLATRSDPPVRLQRLRVAGELTEIRAADLAFTETEAAELLRELDLPAAQVKTLWTRTEGWAAALRLAELSLHNHPDPSAFISGFAGDDRAVSDYLTSEVLSAHDEETLGFLLRTSIVDRLNGELAEALAGVASGSHTIHELSRVEGLGDEQDEVGAELERQPGGGLEPLERLVAVARPELRDADVGERQRAHLHGDRPVPVLAQREPGRAQRLLDVAVEAGSVERRRRAGHREPAAPLGG